ncbi:hypothetical protein LF1_31870 [Rubripirellula obstinata]|uniref:Uncharacterized protein n=1 Tax=Rubripirellula obstinata TaxID=406547 RepID=A0A5B1CHG7_9BACT|nr:hypothetical protein [Rubripirellula obstinata]KAA1260647.1 hypothetical protein LF1_31870 [Rubripirellula obstinata]
MAKYYVQSGTLRTIVSAESAGKAAIWAVHQAMQQVFPMDGDSPVPQDKPAAVLASKLSVSEQGFDRNDSVVTPTIEVVSQWNEMVSTLDRLQQMLHRAA